MKLNEMGLSEQQLCKDTHTSCCCSQIIPLFQGVRSCTWAFAAWSTFVRAGAQAVRKKGGDPTINVLVALSASAHVWPSFSCSSVLTHFENLGESSSKQQQSKTRKGASFGKPKFIYPCRSFLREQCIFRQ